MCGWFHIAAAMTTFTFCPPESAPMRVCVPNSLSRPTSSRCFSTLTLVSGVEKAPARCATFSSTTFMCFSKPHLASFVELT